MLFERKTQVINGNCADFVVIVKGDIPGSAESGYTVQKIVNGEIVVTASCRTAMEVNKYIETNDV